MDRSRRLKFFLGVGFGVVCVVTTMALVLVLRDSETLAKFPSYGHEQAEDAITFEEFINGEFGYKTFNGSWWSETELQWKNAEGDLVLWDLETNETSILVSHDLLTSFDGGAQFQGFSPDNKLLLFASNISNVWRHSFTAVYTVYNPDTNSSFIVRDKDNSETLQYCDWVENNEFDNTLIYVSKNNLYWRTNALEDAAGDVTITDSGVVDNVFNGIPDWVYEEEVLSVNYAHYINDIGDKVAFAEFNDTNVKDFRYPWYGDQHDVFNAQYPEYRVVRYPKAGETNPTLQLFVRSMRAGEENTINKPVKPPAEVTAWGEYIYTVADWTESEVLSVTWMNRIQNESVTSRCEDSGNSWDCVSVFPQRQSDGWIEIMDPPVYDGEDLNIFLQILPSLQNDGDGLTWPHLGRVNTSNPSAVFWLTEGSFVVKEILAWDSDTDLVYFMGTMEGRPASSHLYTVRGSGEGEATCVTCDLKTSRGDTCHSNSIDINADNKYYIHTCRGQGLPESVLRRTSDNALVYLFEKNEKLEEKLSVKTLPDMISTNVSIGDGDFLAPVKILTPPHMEEGAQYPVIVYVYGGPGYQQVTDTWTIGWGEYLVTSRNIVYVLMDTRGTGGQSNEHLFSVYRNLGTVEMEDEIAVTRELVSSYSFMDPTRVAMWGWSYGGFNTAMTLEKDAGEAPVFKCGISVAPVSSWLLYDSIYTERYMALPTDNVAGYNNSLITGIDNLRNKKWMLNHGVADDNVHYQHSMLLTKELEQRDVQFVQHSYADENHSLRGVSRFLYHAMDNFWGDCFTTKDFSTNSATMEYPFKTVLLSFVMLIATNICQKL